jgi:hypothetical protein
LIDHFPVSTHGSCCFARHHTYSRITLIPRSALTLTLTYSLLGLSRYTLCSFTFSYLQSKCLLSREPQQPTTSIQGTPRMTRIYNNNQNLQSKLLPAGSLPATTTTTSAPRMTSSLDDSVRRTTAQAAQDGAAPAAARTPTMYPPTGSDPVRAAQATASHGLRPRPYPSSASSAACSARQTQPTRQPQGGATPTLYLQHPTSHPRHRQAPRAGLAMDEPMKTRTVSSSRTEILPEIQGQGRIFQTTGSVKANRKNGPGTDSLLCQAVDPIPPEPAKTIPSKPSPIVPATQVSKAALVTEDDSERPADAIDLTSLNIDLRSNG